MVDWRLRYTKEKVAILSLWFGVLIAVRLLIGAVLQDVWIGTLGAVAITFGIFYGSIRFTPMQKHRESVNSSLASWYRRRFFYITGVVSMLLLGGIMFLIQFGHTNYGDRLLALNMPQEDFQEALLVFRVDDEMGRSPAEVLDKYSALEIAAITLASADKTLDGYYSKLVSYMFAEDIEITIFLLLFRTRREIFSAPSLRSSSLLKNESSLAP